MEDELIKGALSDAPLEGRLARLASEAKLWVSLEELDAQYRGTALLPTEGELHFYHVLTSELRRRGANVERYERFYTCLVRAKAFERF